MAGILDIPGKLLALPVDENPTKILTLFCHQCPFHCLRCRESRVECDFCRRNSSSLRSNAQESAFQSFFATFTVVDFHWLCQAVVCSRVAPFPLGLDWQLILWRVSRYKCMCHYLRSPRLTASYLSLSLDFNYSSGFVVFHGNSFCVFLYNYKPFPKLFSCCQFLP